MGEEMKAPFPWFGGKSRVASTIWDALGNPPNYVEPFAGSLAVLLARPHAPGLETINDIDCYVSNFWRALQADPDGVARHCDWPVNETDLLARHRWLVAHRDEHALNMSVDPSYYDAKVAGWWVWGLSAWIGSGWCAPIKPGRDVKHQRPHLTHAGMGVHRKSLAGGTLLQDYLFALAQRLRRVRVACGDWTRIMGSCAPPGNGTTGVLLDPPYPKAIRDQGCYVMDTDPFAGVVRWAIEHEDDPKLRIVVCGYGSELATRPGWQSVPWKANGGYGNFGGERARENATKECLYLSPHTLKGENTTGELW